MVDLVFVSCFPVSFWPCFMMLAFIIFIAREIPLLIDPHFNIVSVQGPVLTSNFSRALNSSFYDLHKRA